MQKIKLGDYVKITKISDLKFKGNHPNNVYEGHSQIGRLVDFSEDNRCNVIGKGINDFLSTSMVVKINDDNTFETINSIYKLELHSLPEEVIAEIGMEELDNISKS